MRLTEKVHDYLSVQLKPGDNAIDATAGNGHDTAQMACLVGLKGHIIAIDIQESAIESTRKRLSNNNCLRQTQLLTGEHSKVLQVLCSTHTRKISAIVFNLGYLPGSDKSIQTIPATTLRALDASRQLLRPNGILLVTAYRGHYGGQTEADCVAEWMKQTGKSDWFIKSYEPETGKNGLPPILWTARKLPVNSC